MATEPRIKKIISDAARTSAKCDVSIAIAPPQHMIGSAIRYAASVTADTSTALVKRGKDIHHHTGITILAQHVDYKDAGSTTGYMIPEMLKKIGIAGSIINHSEHRVSSSAIPPIIAKLDDLGMISVLCVRNVAEAAKYAKIKPDYIAIEPPELIGSGRAVSTEKPELISNAAKAIAPYNTKLLCGAGIISGADVDKAASLGSAGVLVASGVIKNPTRWKSIMYDLAKPLAAHR